MARRRAVLALVLLLVLTGCDRVVRVSRDPAGGDGNGTSGTLREARSQGGIAIDGSGRTVVFESDSTDLLPGGNSPGLFVRDLSTGTIERIASGHTPDITPDGRHIAYADHPYGLSEVWVLDRTTGTRELVSALPDGGASGTSNINPSISDDGTTVVWEGPSASIVPGSSGINIMVRDRTTGATDVASKAADGGQANETSHTPSISGDGRYVAFSSWASNLTVGDTATGSREVFRRDLDAGSTQKVSLDDDGNAIAQPALDPTISADGRYVAFTTGSVLVRDVVTDHTEVASVAGGSNVVGGGQQPAISSDGRMVVFTSAQHLGAGDLNRRNDVYVRDRSRGTTTQLTVTSDFEQLPGDSADAVLLAPAISADGHMSAFGSESPLDPTDHNDRMDVYVRAALRPTISSVTPSVLAPGTTSTLTVLGDGFRLGTTAGIDLPGTAGAHVVGTVVVSDHELQVQVSVDIEAPSGPRTIGVANRTVEPGSPPSILGGCGTCLSVT